MGSRREALGLGPERLPQQHAPCRAARLGGAHEVCEDTRSRRPRCQQRRGGPVASPGAVRPGVKCPRSWRWYFGSRWGSVRFPSRGVKRLSLAQLTGRNGNRRQSGVVSHEATALGQRYDTRGLPPSVAPGLTPRRDCDRHRGPGAGQGRVVIYVSSS